MTIEEISAACKIMSKPESLFIIKCLIRNKMMTSDQIAKEYEKSIPDTRFTELLALKVVAISRYGVFTLDEGVDNFAFIISELDLSNKQRNNIPELINDTTTLGFYITKEKADVFILRTPEGKFLSKHVAEYKAIQARSAAVKRRRESIANKKAYKAAQKKEAARKKRLGVIRSMSIIRDEDKEWLELHREWVKEQYEMEKQEEVN